VRDMFGPRGTWSPPPLITTV